ncbi:MAG: HAMP domain-containing sensor histidine kinase [Lachnospiraceae bacterium]|nr:HAMP domain-containing sensor histidine kinase [Lachnospiraceae bacterium]
MKRRNSIYIRLLKLLVIAAVLSSVYFVVIHSLGTLIVDEFYADSDYINDKDEAYIERLQMYVTKGHIKSKDTDLLNQWTQKQKFVAIQVFHDDILTYDSDYPDEKNIWEEGIKKNFYDWDKYFTVIFQDGECDVSIYGRYFYQFYNYAFLIEILLTVVVFLLVVILGIRRSIHYIQKLANEIEILESGNLEYPITIQGKDELTVLARGLDNMRKSFRSQEEKKEKLIRLNQKLVTEMSHDLRTPLTSIMIYTEILKNEKYKDEAQRKKYFEKISQKAHYMKRLTDNLFEYSLIDSEQEVLLEKPMKFQTAFYDLMSESCTYLRQNSFQVQTDFNWKDCQVQIYTDYVIRIFDNILSNILKYADPNEEIKISSVYQEGYAGFCFQNKKKILIKKENSTQIGIPNIVRMISRMKGICEVKEEDNNFIIYIYFYTGK